jgi:UDP-glucuronate 4-epimerase
MKILVTGAAGFIGRAVCERLLGQAGATVVGVDNLNDYYSVELKHGRLATLQGRSGFVFHKLDVADTTGVNALMQAERPDYVIHLAAQAGVRYSLVNPYAYTQSNLVGTANILEACRQYPVKHLVFASSSSVYGNNTKIPFHEDDPTEAPVSYYAATKKSNELMAQSYAHLYDLPVTGLRFFTVYGPWGRPDMALWMFTESILQGKPIKVFNHGLLQRDFTYIDDIVEGVFRVMNNIPNVRNKCRIFNIGNHQPVALMDFIDTLERTLGKAAIKEYLPMQDGDVPTTYADTSRLREAVGFSPDTPLESGLRRFVDWYIGWKGLARP